MCELCNHPLTELLDHFTQALKGKCLTLAINYPVGSKERPYVVANIKATERIIQGLAGMIRGGPSTLYRAGLKEAIESLEAITPFVTTAQVETLAKGRCYLQTLLSRVDDIDVAVSLPDVLPLGRVDRKNVN